MRPQVSNQNISKVSFSFDSSSHLRSSWKSPSEAVMQRFEVSDDQVMAAIEHFGAKNDPSFKAILQRIATTLSTTLG